MSGSLATPKSKAADLLLQARLLSRQQYDWAIAQVRDTQTRAEEVLIDGAVFSEADLLKALSGVYQTHFVSTEKLSKADIPRATIQMVPRRVAETMEVFPVLFDRQTGLLSVVTPDPDNVELLREVKLVSGAQNIKAFVARPAAIAAAIRKHHGGDARAFELLERTTSMHFDFGQQVLADGRVVAKPEAPSGSTKAGSTRFDTSSTEVSSAGPAPRAAPPPPPPPPPPPAPMPAPRAAPPPPPPPSLPKAARAIPIESVAPQRAASSAPPNPPPVARVRPAARPAPAPPPPDSAPNIARKVDPRVGPKPARQVVRAAHQSHAPAAFVPPSSTNLRTGTRPPQGDSERQAVLQHDTTIELLTVMVSLLENSRQELRGHSSQVARLLRRVAERMNLDRAETYAVIVAGHIHDVGKMGQFHLTALNCSEYEGHRTAAQKAYDTPLRLLEAVRLPPSIKNAVFHMYERFDGNGFPDKLAGKEIPLGARLLSVADTYSDLTQNPRNPARKVLGAAEAMQVLAKHRGTIFDPAIIDLFHALVLGEDMRAKLLANRYTALVIEPDPEESTVLELRMLEQGFDVRTARSIENARKIIATNVEIDLVVCELELPDGDGLAFLSEAKEKWASNVAWVVHTHKQGRTEAQRAFELGAVDFVAKPVPTDVLVAKLKAVLDQGAKNRLPKGVSGSLSEMGLPDIVQVLVHGRKTGKLNIRANGVTGEIHFLDGSVANAVLGHRQGADAFYEMLKFSDGDFSLDPSFIPPKRVIGESSEVLLLEGMRRMDEGL